MSERRSHYRFNSVARGENEEATVVYIEDADGPMSVTNDAERVCSELNDTFPGARIEYKDTDGMWGELVHRAGVFERFGRATGPAQPV